jgi:hypothetical protein
LDLLVYMPLLKAMLAYAIGISTAGLPQEPIALSLLPPWPVWLDYQKDHLCMLSITLQYFVDVIQFSGYSRLNDRRLIRR